MSLVQTIVVKPATHFETIAAAALASGVALAHADVTTDPWSGWLAGSFTKSVRRVKRPIELLHVRQLELARVEIAVGDAIGIAFAPQSYDDAPRALSKLQVSGLDVAETSDRFSHAGAITPRIEINSDVTMTTGKTAAQVAHALGAWLLSQPLVTRQLWAVKPGLALEEVKFSENAADERSIINIVDHGLTEIAPGSPTARVYFDPFV
jgi:hypothetical protein